MLLALSELQQELDSLLDIIFASVQRSASLIRESLLVGLACFAFDASDLLADFVSCLLPAWRTAARSRLVSGWTQTWDLGSRVSAVAEEVRGQRNEQRLSLHLQSAGIGCVWGGDVQPWVDRSSLYNGTPTSMNLLGALDLRE